MGITVSVMYPNSGTKFDMDYYMNTHGPLVKDRWESKGLTGLKVIKGMATPDPDTPPPYQVIALLEFASVEDFQAAVAANGEEVLGDIPNFTDVAPVIQINDNLT